MLREEAGLQTAISRPLPAVDARLLMPPDPQLSYVRDPFTGWPKTALDLVPFARAIEDSRGVRIYGDMSADDLWHVVEPLVLAREMGFLQLPSERKSQKGSESSKRGGGRSKRSKKPKESKEPEKSLDTEEYKEPEAFKEPEESQNPEESREPEE